MSSHFTNLCDECDQLGLRVEMIAGEIRVNRWGPFREIVGLRAAQTVIAGATSEGVASVAVKGLEDLDRAAGVLSSRLSRRDYRDVGF